MVTMTELRTSDVYPGPRRTAIEVLDGLVEVYEETLNLAIDAEDWAGAVIARHELKAFRAERELLFNCSIHEIDGAREWYTGRGPEVHAATDQDL